MKKVLCLILALSVVMLLGAVSFAAGTATVPDSAIPGGQTVDLLTYAKTPVVIPDEQNAGGKTNGTTDGSISNEAVPGGDAALPKTGGIPAETFYVAGALIVLAAFIVSRKKVKASAK